jgi:hypothetical protein
MRFGLLGFPKVGKTTLFNILTGAGVAVDKYAGGSGPSHIGVAKVVDPRVDRLARMFHPKKITYAQFEFLDVQGVHRGEAKESVPLKDMRNVDAIAHVVRAFHDEEIAHSEGSIDPRRDVETMETELLLADLDVAQRRLERLHLNLKKAKNKEDLKPEELKRIRGFAFLTAKPLLIILNLDEKDAARVEEAAGNHALRGREGRPRTAVCAISAKVEEEIARLDPQDARAFLDDLGLREPARDRVIHAGFRLLGLVQFLSAGEDECRGWAIPAGTKAPQAAGAVHTDMERGFIRAEVVALEDLVAAGSLHAAREKALLRSEGRDYVVKDGDVINFRFNV